MVYEKIGVGSRAVFSMYHVQKTEKLLEVLKERDCCIIQNVELYEEILNEIPKRLTTCGYIRDFHNIKNAGLKYHSLIDGLIQYLVENNVKYAFLWSHMMDDNYLDRMSA
jgi:hypothetical protein